MSDTKRQVIERIDELVEALAAYEYVAGRRVNLIVRADGTSVLMGEEVLQPDDEDEPAMEAIEEFADFADLAETLLGKAAA